ncbi:hypothetical protein BURPS668_2018 [Burkholderia pseudomallei 668]|nr:hypothetical protein BURPS668_2018 [Burkholderia pseudomallei 668]
MRDAEAPPPGAPSRRIVKARGAACLARRNSTVQIAGARLNQSS